MIVLLLLLGGNPPEDILVDYVDMVEYNVHYRVDECGFHTQYMQMVFWKDQHVIAWRKVECAWPYEAFNGADLITVKHPGYGQFKRGANYLLFHDKHDRLRKVYFQHFRESWVDYDTEIRDREVWPKDYRSGLCRPMNLK